LKLFVQVPCLNEENTIGDVLKTIPKKIHGISTIDILIIDDGSTDKTIEVAKKHGVKHFLRHKKNMGLSKSFMDGVDYCIYQGADIVVNTDGDNQYKSKEIPKLVKPILDGDADIVIGDRQTQQIKHFGPLKKFLQKTGSWFVNQVAQTDVNDTVSGFRAYTKDAANKIMIVNSFSYCTESIIHAGRKRIPIISVPIETNPPTRPSRLFKNMFQHVYKSTRVILKGYFMYEPLKIFFSIGILLIILGSIPSFRYLYLLRDGDPGQHLQSLLIGVAFLVGGVVFINLGIIGDLIKTNRIYSETILEKIRSGKLSG